MATMALRILLLAVGIAADSTPITVINNYDDDLFRFSFGNPGHCVGEKPECGDVDSIKKGVNQTFVLAPGAN